MNHLASHRTTARVLAALLAYPDDGLLEALPEIRALLDDDRQLSTARLATLRSLIDGLLAQDPIDAQAGYVDCFDRGRATSLHLFEHVHGDSRDRGPAMIDLGKTYAEAGLLLASNELPDYLPAVLEFASTQEPATARAFLAETAHILNAIHAALVKRGSPYAAVLAAVIELAGETPAAVNVPDDEPLDASWAEPEAFGGCNAKGQQAPGQPQPVQIVRRGAASAPASPSH